MNNLPVIPTLAALPALQTARHPLALASALALVALPAAAQSQWGVLPASALSDINSTQINFAGHEWVVIGNDAQDIYKNTTYGSSAAPSNSVTLLLNHDGDTTTPGYEAGGGFPVSSVHEYQFRADTGGTCFGTYAGSCNNYPNEYDDSDLQNRMEAIAADLPGKEQGVINARSLEAITDALPANLARWTQAARQVSTPPR